MRVPLSWLRDFAPIDGDPAGLAETLDDLGLVVEAVERVGEGLEDVVVARVESIAAIAGADRIRLVTVESGNGPLEVVCGAWNFSPGDLVPLAPVGAVLPGGFKIGRRKMKGAVSNGMLCSGRELGLTDDHEGIFILGEALRTEPGTAFTEALGIQADVVFHIDVEANRPDAWSMAGVARDLAARLRLPFTVPEPAPPPDLGVEVSSVASLVVEDHDLCPRMVVRVVSGLSVAPSPRWIAQRLLLAGMRPVNQVVDASNYVMLELGQPTHPYDLDKLAGGGLRVRRAKEGERLITLDGTERILGTPGRGLGDAGEDCVICDAEGSPVGIGGIMGGASSEISDATTRVLLEAAYFSPIAISRTSKRLGLRTEASARFERGCDPWGIDLAVARFCALVGAPAASGSLDVRGEVPGPRSLSVPMDRVASLLGVRLGAGEAASLLEPIGFGCEERDDGVDVTVPTSRPDVRPPPHGVADVVEEIGRMYGYSKIPRHQPSWPEPGGLADRQRERRLAGDVLCGLGALEAWTPTLVDDADHASMGLAGLAVAVANPIVREEAWLRRSMLPGLCRALAYNARRRQGEVRLFEVGTVFSHPDLVSRPSRAAGGAPVSLPGERELLAAVFAAEGDDARVAVAAWRVLAGALRLAGAEIVADETLSGLHPTRSARLEARGVGAPGGHDVVVGSVGEVDPAVAAAFGLAEGRVGWLEVDLGLVLDRASVARLDEEVREASRFPSADVDLALVAPDRVPAGRVLAAVEAAGGELLESVELFDVYRGPSVDEGSRSLAYRLRFCAPDRTLTDEEVGALRQRCIDAAGEVGATLR